MEHPHVNSIFATSPKPRLVNRPVNSDIAKAFPRYLHKRGTHFYFRRKIPSDVADGFVQFRDQVWKMRVLEQFNCELLARTGSSCSTGVIWMVPSSFPRLVPGITSKQSRSIVRPTSSVGCIPPVHTRLFWMDGTGGQHTPTIGRGPWHGSGEVNQPAANIGRP